MSRALGDQQEGKHAENSVSSLQKMSLKRLALVGDALWGQVAVEVLIVAGLDKMEISKPDKPGPLAA